MSTHESLNTNISLFENFEQLSTQSRWPLVTTQKMPQMAHGVKFHGPGEPSINTRSSIRYSPNDLHVKVNVCADLPGLILQKNCNQITNPLAHLQAHRNLATTKNYQIFHEKNLQVQEDVNSIENRMVINTSGITRNLAKKDITQKSVFPERNQSISTGQLLVSNQQLENYIKINTGDTAITLKSGPSITTKGKNSQQFSKKENIITTSLSGSNIIKTKTSPQPSLRMEWEDFQNLDEWVKSMAQESIMEEQTITQDILFGGVDELLVEDETQINSNESVVQRPMSNTSTILSSIHEEQNFDDGMMWPSDTYIIGGSPPVFENIITQQNIYTTSNKSDDLLENELSIIPNDNNILLVKGINSSNYSKSLDHIYEDISETSLDYNNSHLDWHKVGLKSDNNNVMFSPPHLQQTPTPQFNQTSKNVYMNAMCSPSSSTASSPPLPTTSTTVLTPLNNVVVPTKNIMASHKLPTLQLDLIPQTLSQKEIIDTPDVINTILACRAEDFDLMAYINDDTVDTVISTDVPDVIKKEITSTLSKKPQKRPYTPMSTNSNDSSDSMPVLKKQKPSTSYENTTVPVARRGRPPKSRTNSISSDDTDSSKYRELRDKNNEASRRSRINRKLREASMETEALQLERENIRLTAQVKELDQLVSRMRDALLTTVIKSKNA